MNIYSLPFWYWLIFFFVYIPIVILWVAVTIDIFRRHDMSGGAKFLWLLGVFVFPFLGSLVYLLVRPAEPTGKMEMQSKRAA